MSAFARDLRRHYRRRMPETEPGTAQEHSPFNTLLRSISIFAVAFVVYVLSPGPVAKFLMPRNFNALLNPSSLEKSIIGFYAPLGYCADHSPAVHRFYDWYIEKVWHAE
jgi:hypothetical protein